MIEFMRIQRFKTLMDASFPLARINLFSGLNGMGKSSLLQVLLLLRQSFERHTLIKEGLLLKGDYVSLGTGQDVLSEGAEVESIEFAIKWQDIDMLSFSFNYAPQHEIQPIEAEVQIPHPERLSLFNSCFQYLSADRIGPKTSYEMSDYHVNNLNSIGIHGEYTVHCLAEYGTKNLEVAALKHPKSSSMSLIDNLNNWMAELSPGIRIQATLQRQLNSVSLCYAFGQEKKMTTNFKPQNVGFGLTYTLPVITAILRAKPGDLLIIENPESHLHPTGQAMIGKIFAIAAAAGVQIFVESHSDHFLNGIRVAVKEGIIAPDDVRLYFLERDPLARLHSSTVIAPELDKDGRISIWPTGFFDEWDKQLERLL